MNWSSHWVDGSVTKTLILENNDGNDTEISAIVIGDLAVHQSLDGQSNWRVIHVPTLTSFMSAVPVIIIKNNDDCKQALINWCQIVQERHKNDWAALRALTPEYYDDIAYEAKLRIREWCLSNEVRND